MDLEVEVSLCAHEIVGAINRFHDLARSYPRLANAEAKNLRSAILRLDATLDQAYLKTRDAKKAAA